MPEERVAEFVAAFNALPPRTDAKADAAVIKTAVSAIEVERAAIQKVLAACKEFGVPCGYPATAADIEKRIQQGFSVFIINWGEQGFRAVEIGRTATGR